MAVEALRAEYKLGRAQLESIWGDPAHYQFRHTVTRWDIPPDMAGKVPAEQVLQFEIYGQKGRWRFDLINPGPGGTETRNVVVATAQDQFQANRRFNQPAYTLTSLSDDVRTVDSQLLTARGLFGSSFMLPTRFDVADVVLGPNYQLTEIQEAAAVPGEGGHPRTVGCRFARAPGAEAASRRNPLIWESGRLSFLPDRAWALDRFTMTGSTGLTYDGHVEYQEVAGMMAPAVPKRTEMTSANAKNSLKTRDVMEAVAIVPGPIADAVFVRGQFEAAANPPPAPPPRLAEKLPEGRNWAGLLVGLGLVLIVGAVGLRVLAARRTPEGARP